MGLKVNTQASALSSQTMILLLVSHTGICPFYIFKKSQAVVGRLLLLKAKMQVYDTGIVSTFKTW